MAQLKYGLFPNSRSERDQNLLSLLILICLFFAFYIFLSNFLLFSSLAFLLAKKCSIVCLTILRSIAVGFRDHRSFFANAAEYFSTGS